MSVEEGDGFGWNHRPQLPVLARLDVSVAVNVLRAAALLAGDLFGCHELGLQYSRNLIRGVYRRKIESFLTVLQPPGNQRELCSKIVLINWPEGNRQGARDGHIGK